MRRTLLTLSVITTFIATWLVISVIIWLLTDLIAYKEVLRHPAMFIFMLVFGWFPCIPVYSDLEERI